GPRPGSGRWPPGRKPDGLQGEETMTYLGRIHRIVGVAVARAGTLMQGSRLFPPACALRRTKLFTPVSWEELLRLRVAGGSSRGGDERVGGVSNVDIDGNNALQIKAIGVIISTFETLPPAHRVRKGQQWSAELSIEPHTEVMEGHLRRQAPLK